MKRIYTLVLAALMTMSAMAQEVQAERNQTYRIVLSNVQYAHHDEKLSTGDAIGKVLTGVLTGQTSVQASKYEEDVKNAIIKGLAGAYRFIYDDSLIPLKKCNADNDVTIDAKIMNIQAKSSSRTWKDKDKKTQVTTTYTAEIEVMLMLKGARIGDIIANTTINGHGTTSSSYSTSDQAVRDALDKLSVRITEWLNKFRPLQANIIEGSAAKKEKQKEVYIDLGSNEGAFAGLHMAVFMVKRVGGHEARTQIGKLKIEAVEGDDISRCKIQNGGKDIKSAIDAGQKLLVVSI